VGGEAEGGRHAAAELQEGPAGDAQTFLHCRKVEIVLYHLLFSGYLMRQWWVPPA